MTEERNTRQLPPEPLPDDPVRLPIRARCPRYACRECRTKTGWPHQVWCGMKAVTEPECADCRYWSVRDAVCDHPAARRERAAK